MDGERIWKPRLPSIPTGLEVYVCEPGADPKLLSEPSGGGASGGRWRALRSPAIALLPYVRLIGDFRVLGCTAIAMLFVCALVVTFDDRPACAVKRQGPAAPSPENLRDEPAARAEPAAAGAAGSVPRAEKAPGDFFADLQLAFSGGHETGLVQLPDSGEERLFDSWREVLGPGCSFSGLLFRKIAKGPEGGDIYQIIDDSARISGFIAISWIEGRWRVVGARYVLDEGPKGADPKMLELLDGIRGRGGKHPGGPPTGGSGSTGDRGGPSSPREVERP